jgi:molybdopterin-guanine dinucleotide biosynthesis protein A
MHEWEPVSTAKNNQISAYITVGGASSRFRGDKSVHIYNGKPLIKHVYDVLASVFGDVCVISNDAGKFQFLGCTTMPDIIPGLGPIGGIMTALTHSKTEKIFMCACDMPNLSASFIAHMIEVSTAHDIIVPRTGKGYQPLHAVYSKKCLPYINELIGQGRRQIISFYDKVDVCEIDEDEVKKFADPEILFSNINFREDLG